MKLNVNLNFIPHCPYHTTCEVQIFPLFFSIIISAAVTKNLKLFNKNKLQFFPGARELENFAKE